MERMQLEASSREKKGKGPARQARMKGLVPAVLYGQGQAGVNLIVNPKELAKILGKGGTNILLDLKIEGQSSIPVMVKEYQADILSRAFLHVDFLKVDLTKKITVEVPIHLVGKPLGLKEGGILEHITRSIEVICLPTAIPEFLEADVSHLNVGDNLHAHDLKLPAGIELPSNVDFTIAAVAMPKEEKEPVATAEVQQPEVTGQKKAGEEAATAAAPAKDAGKKEGKK